MRDDRLGDWATTEIELELEALSTPNGQQLGQHWKMKQKYIGVNKMECDTISRDHIDEMTRTESRAEVPSFS